MAIRIPRILRAIAALALAGSLTACVGYGGGGYGGGYGGSGYRYGGSGYAPRYSYSQGYGHGGGYAQRGHGGGYGGGGWGHRR